MNLEEQRPLLDRADEEERGDISSNNDVTGQEQKEVVESIIQNYVCFTLYKQDWLVLLACFLGVGLLDGSMYSNGIFINKISQDLGITEEAIQGAASLEVVVSALMCFVASFLTQKYKSKVVASGGALLAVLGW